MMSHAANNCTAVAILALLKSKIPDEPLSTIIIEQYRPPAGNFVIELPAGLIDEGENAETAAVRELEEETGLKVSRIVKSSPVQVSDPGMTTANMKLIIVEAEVNSSDDLPMQKLDAGEHIVRRIVRLDALNAELNKYAERGFAIDARLSHFAIGWDLSLSTTRV